MTGPDIAPWLAQLGARPQARYKRSTRPTEHPMSRLAALTLATALCASTALAQAQTATAPLKNGKGEEVGKVTLTAAPKGVLIRVEAKGLMPGWHGLHLHEKADCSKADFTSAGAHTHGGGERVHGLLNPKGSESGDLPNIFAD